MAQRPRARIGETILYKPMKTVLPDNDTERKWKYGIWLGVVEHTGEHIVGTKEGTVKCKAISQLTPDKRFDQEMLDGIQGTPWKPSPHHKSWKLRANIEGGQDDEPEAAGDWKVS